MGDVSSMVRVTIFDPPASLHGTELENEMFGNTDDCSWLGTCKLKTSTIGNPLHTFVAFLLNTSYLQ